MICILFSLLGHYYCFLYYINLFSKPRSFKNIVVWNHITKISLYYLLYCLRYFLTKYNSVQNRGVEFCRNDFKTQISIINLICSFQGNSTLGTLWSLKPKLACLHTCLHVTLFHLKYTLFHCFPQKPIIILTSATYFEVRFIYLFFCFIVFTI